MIDVIEKLRSNLATRAAGDDAMKLAVTRLARTMGYDLRHLGRVVYQDQCRQWLSELRPERLDVLEVSAGAAWRDMGFHSYTEMNYPEHDICANWLDRQFDLIIADQVFEHLLWPGRACANVFAMLRPGGHFLIMTPFLVRIHEVPVDCTRWTETGIRYFLAEAGFELDGIRSGAWGNRAALKANLVTWARVGWRRRFPNEASFPLSVWALARKSRAIVS